MYTIFDTLNNAFTYIATAYIYFMAIALVLLFVQAAMENFSQETTVSDEFYQQTKQAGASSGAPLALPQSLIVERLQPLLPERRCPGGHRRCEATAAASKLRNTKRVRHRRAMAKPQGGLLAVEPKKPSNPQGKAMKLTVETKAIASKPQAEDPWFDTDFSTMGIRAIRQYVRDHFLQDLIKSSAGKSVAKCTLSELRTILIESQESDRVYSRILEI